MPDAKRRRRRKHERTRAGPATASGASRAAPAARPAPQQMPLPSNTARATGFMIAVVTLFLGVLVMVNAVRGQSGVTAATQVIGGLLLIVIALVVAALVAIPGQVRRWLHRRRA